MRLTTVQLAFPYLKYKVRVSHYTQRKPTVFEWAAMQAIGIADRHREYDRVSAAEIFDMFFGVSDADMLIKPVLLSLRDSDLIYVERLDDGTSLNDLSMDRFHLTDNGKVMLREGVLPAQNDEAQLELDYNVQTLELKPSLNESTRKTSAEGVPLLSEEEIEGIVFPEASIRAYLEEAKGERTYNWLTNETTIGRIEPMGEVQITWKNVTRELTAGEGLICTVKDVFNNGVLQRLIEKLKSNLSTADPISLPLIECRDPDREIKMWTSTAELDDLIRRQLQTEKLFIMRERDFNVESLSTMSGMVILCESERFEFAIDRRQIVLRIPDRVLKVEEVIAGSNGQINRGIFKFKLGDQTLEMPLAYVPRSNAIPFDDRLRQLLDECRRLHFDELLERLWSDEFEPTSLPAQLSIERTLVDMKKIYADVHEMLKVHDSIEDLRAELLIKDRGTLIRLNDLQLRWGDVKEKLERQFDRFEECMANSDRLKAIEGSMVRVREALSIFDAGNAIKESKVLVADARLLKEIPELTEAIVADKSHALIAVEDPEELLPTALRYKLKDVSMISDDEELRTRAKGMEGIKPFSSEGFMSMLRHSNMSNEKSKVKGGKKNKKRKK